jgi:superoxide dismutase
MADYTLPDLPYDYAALEPHVSAQIMELHHDKHHAAYVTGANQTLEKLAAARDKDDFGPSWDWRRPWPSTSRATCCTPSSGRT